jgi:hypothetical protein
MIHREAKPLEYAELTWGLGHDSWVSWTMQLLHYSGSMGSGFKSRGVHGQKTAPVLAKVGYWSGFLFA